jgi:hypothetical protein
MRTKIKKGGILALAILLVAAVVAAWSFVTPTQKLNSVSSAAGESNAGIVFKNPEFSFQLLKALSSSAYDASDVGECAIGIGKGLELCFSAAVAKRLS